MSAHASEPGPWLQANLAALAHADARLAERLCWPVSTAQVERQADGRWHYRFRGQALPFEEPTASFGSGPLFFFGIGPDTPLDAALAAGARVVAWDRDPCLVRLALGRRDYQQPLRDGRLRLLLGADLLHQAAGLRGLPRIRHPLLARVYALEDHLVDAPLDAPLALVACGALFVDDVAESLRAAGFRTYGLDLAGLSREELALTVVQLRPALLFAVNYTDGLAEWSEDCGVTTLCWEVDPATSPLAPCAGSTSKTHVFTWRRAHVDLFRAAGFTHVEHLPLAANPRRRAPVAAAPLPAPAFVGASLQQEIPTFERIFVEAVCAFTRGTAGHAAVLLQAARGEQSRDYAHDRMAAILEHLCPGVTREPSGQALRAASEIAAADKRAAYVRALGARGPGIDVWGDAGWGVLAQSPGVRFHGAARHTQDVNAIYSAAAVTIDIGRLYQGDIVTMRVFDALSCGGVLLAEWSQDLESLFGPLAAHMSYRTLDELLSRTDHLLANPSEARAVASQARALVLAHHTIDLRVAHMLAVAGIAPPRGLAPGS